MLLPRSIQRLRLVRFGCGHCVGNGIVCHHQEPPLAPLVNKNKQQQPQHKSHGLQFFGQQCTNCNFTVRQASQTARRRRHRKGSLRGRHAATQTPHSMSVQLRCPMDVAASEPCWVSLCRHRLHNSVANRELHHGGLQNRGEHCARPPTMRFGHRSPRWQTGGKGVSCGVYVA